MDYGKDYLSRNNQFSFFDAANTGISRSNIIAGLHKAIAERIIATAKRIGIKADIVVTGGVANNVGCVQELERGLGLSIGVPERPEITAAYGAALMAAKLAL